MGLLIALNASGMVAYYACVILLGGGFGVCLPSLMTLPGNYFGQRAYALVVSIFMVVGTTAGAVASSAGGYVFDRTGSYREAFVFVAVLCFAGFVVLLLLRPPLRKAAAPLAAASRVH